MSMISSLIDELRKLADGQAPYRDAREVMLRAADTIWELRDDLQRANDAVQEAEHDESMAWDRVRKAEAENDKLRELVRNVYALHWNGLDCTECPWICECDTDGGCPWLGIMHDHMRELGIEVDDG